ncbi:preprotein translocase YidC [Mycobacterium gordonae]|uniref:Membrane protein insertase YidC n=1 Tax=Mycobacterium gordonae TaxID=1778 RepID=A0A0Q2U9C1_MYCGO|nr:MULTISPECIES: membrane protein insertase YidC [Mycobacterium]KQH77152.1 preprotein translocase YidC [Mycobacterium gordonae]MDP7731346.1 membrane protein insertase YidC [Mycobacterium sp. TY813]
MNLLFDFFSLDFIYYPVSWIMWLWYKAFAFLLGPDNFFAWALSVMFLVFTLRALLYKPFVRQIRTTRQMQELQPQIKALQKKYGKDRQRMALEMQKLQREHGFNPILGCLPMLAQIPVFLGLYHVLRSFNRTTGGIGLQSMSVEQNKMIGNYVFTALDVQNFLKANLFGAPIGASMTQKGGLDAFEHFSRPAVIAVGVPVMILAGVATYFNSRASVARQSPEAAANPQTAMMNKLALYVFPLGVVVGGPFLPLAIILYWFANNIWTFGQQHYVFGMIEKEDEAKKQEALERRAANAPAPGVKPKRTKSTSATSTGSAVETASADAGTSETEEVDIDGQAEAKPADKSPQAPSAKPSAVNRSSGPGRTPRPGARPKKRKR